MQPIEFVNELRENTRISMEKHRLLAKDRPNSSIIDEPPINIPLEQVVDDNDTILLLQVGYGMNEVREGMDAIPLDEEVPMMEPSIRQPDVLETILEPVVFSPTIVAP